ncbi:MAG: lytic transglycosylase domain-containing protein [Lachnospiraceae bacterium]|nr:lytic transglycosylase domain-containing protein [Lachnospiraceae bacterium]
MRVSIVTGDGTTTYTEQIQQVAVEEEDFSTVLDEAVNATSDIDTVSLDAGSLEDIFAEAAQTYQVDVNLLKAIAKQESNFQPDATSSSGAQGIMQLMPATAESLGVTDAYDPYENIMGGAKLISKLLNQYQGDITLALAAYNAGSGNVAKYGGVPPFEETQNYVVKVQQYYQNGVDVPDVQLSDSRESKAETAQKLVTMLSEFPSHSSYQIFLSQMQQALEQDTNEENSSDAQRAYERLLGNSNQVIIHMLSNIE